MRPTDPNGQEWLVTRRWWPLSTGEDPRPQEQVAPVLPAEFAGLVLRVLLLPVVVALRTVHVLGWPVEAWRGGELVRAESVRGWARSRRRMADLSESIRRGEPVVPARRTDHDGGTA